MADDPQKTHHPFYDALQRFALEVMTQTGQPVTRVEVSEALHVSLGLVSMVNTAAGPVEIRGRYSADLFKASWDDGTPIDESSWDEMLARGLGRINTAPAAATPHHNFAVGDMVRMCNGGFGGEYRITAILRAPTADRAGRYSLGHSLEAQGDQIRLVEGGERGEGPR